MFAGSAVGPWCGNLCTQFSATRERTLGHRSIISSSSLEDVVLHLDDGTLGLTQHSKERHLIEACILQWYSTSSKNQYYVNLSIRTEILSNPVYLKINPA